MSTDEMESERDGGAERWCCGAQVGVPLCVPSPALPTPFPPTLSPLLFQHSTNQLFRATRVPIATPPSPTQQISGTRALPTPGHPATPSGGPQHQDQSQTGGPPVWWRSTSSLHQHTIISQLKKNPLTHYSHKNFNPPRKT